MVFKETAALQVPKREVEEPCINLRKRTKNRNALKWAKPFLRGPARPAAARCGLRPAGRISRPGKRGGVRGTQMGIANVGGGCHRIAAEFPLFPTLAISERPSDVGLALKSTAR